MNAEQPQQGIEVQPLQQYAVPEKHSVQAFVGQLDDEKALFIMRRHWMEHVRNACIAAGLLVLLIVFVVLLRQTVLQNVSANAQALLIVMGILYILLFAFIRWIHHRLSLIILTDRRVVWIKQRTMFSRSVIEALLGQVEDVRMEVHGFFPTVLHYGEVIVETAKATIKFQKIPRPSLVVGQILKLVEKRRAQEKAEAVAKGTTSYVVGPEGIEPLAPSS